MNDYTQLVAEARQMHTPVEPHSASHDVLRLCDALAACQRERDELAAAIFGEPQPDETFEETRRMAADQVAAYDYAELHAAELSSARDAADVPLPEQLTLEGEVVDG